MVQLSKLRCLARADALRAASGVAIRLGQESAALRFVATAVSGSDHRPTGSSGTVFNAASVAAEAADPGAPGPGTASRLAFDPSLVDAAAAEHQTGTAGRGSPAGALPAPEAAAAAADGVSAAEGSQQQDRGTPDNGELSEEQRDVLATIVREALASEAAAEQLVRAQRAVLGSNRPDLAAVAADQQAATDSIRALAPDLRARPSALAPVWAAAGATVGAFAGIAPSNFSNAIRGGVAEALTERYTDHLRRLAAIGAGSSPAADALRAAIRKLRDIPRAPADAPPPADIIAMAMNQQMPRNMSAAEGVGGAVKLVFQGMFAVSSHV